MTVIFSSIVDYAFRLAFYEIMNCFNELYIYIFVLHKSVFVSSGISIKTNFLIYFSLSRAHFLHSRFFSDCEWRIEYRPAMQVHLRSTRNNDLDKGWNSIRWPSGLKRRFFINSSKTVDNLLLNRCKKGGLWCLLL